MTDASRSRGIASIQMLRAFAAALVVLSHSLLSVYAGRMPTIAEHASWMLGVMGVLVFFVISGCLMTITSAGRFGCRGAPLVFLRKRAWRIVPLYWLMTGLYIGLLSNGGVEVAAADVVRSLLFIPYSAGGPPLRPILQVGWTLNYEMFFYVLFAGALLLPLRFGLVALTAVFLGLVAAGALLKSLADTSDPATLAQAWTNPIILVFLAGALIAVLRPALTRLQPMPPLVLVSIAAAVVFIAGTIWSVLDVYPRTFLEDATLRGACVVAVVVCLVPETMLRGAVGRLLYALGNASYSTYLTHLFVIRYASRPMLAAHVPCPAILVTMLLLAHAIGYVVYCLVEVPILSLNSCKWRLLRIFERAGPPRNAKWPHSAEAKRDQDVIG